jgi:F-type H+-transporting ATPase subunit delta
MSNETVSRRYALALADVVTKSGETDTVRTELKIWEQLLVANPDLQNAFANPAITHPKKEKVLEELIARSKPSKTTSNFLRVLLRNGRLMELDDINTRFESVIEDRSGVVSADVTSARELGEAQKNELKASLERVTGRQVKLNYAVDPDLIGGVVTRVGSTVYDGSVKTQLQNLKEEMMGS